MHVVLNHLALAFALIAVSHFSIVSSELMFLFFIICKAFFRSCSSVCLFIGSTVTLCPCFEMNTAFIMLPGIQVLGSLLLASVSPSKSLNLFCWSCSQNHTLQQQPIGPQFLSYNSLAVQLLLAGRSFFSDFFKSFN